MDTKYQVLLTLVNMIIIIISIVIIIHRHVENRRFIARQNLINKYTKLRSLQYVTHDELISLGFVHIPGTLINGYSLNINWFESEHYKTLSISLNPGNVYVYLREASDTEPDNRVKDHLICIYNEDIHGILNKSKVNDMVKMLTTKK